MKYKAFISYRHCQPDSAAAKKIINIVETYGIPKTIIEKHHTSKKVGKLFRDEDELSASANLSKTITDALDNSEYLIMLCSPEYLESEWCMLEFNYWMEHKGKETIIPILIKGEPETSFPEKLTESGQPLAIDIRGKNEKEILRNIRDQKLRIVAALISCDYDDLRQRDKEQARQARAMSAGAILSVICVFSVIVAYLQGKANNELNLKNIQIEENLIQISDQNEEINEKNIELESQNNEMKLLNAYICSENAAFLAEKKQYDNAAKKVLEAYDICSDLGDEKLLQRLTYQLVDYMNLYDPERQITPISSLTIHESFHAPVIKGQTIMYDCIDSLKFFDAVSGELLCSYNIKYFEQKPYLISENRFMLCSEADTSSGKKCSVSIHNISDGSSCSYEFDEELNFFDEKIYTDNDSIVIMSDNKVYEFDYSCNLLGSYDIKRPEGFGIANTTILLNTNSILYVYKDRMFVYDIRKQEFIADFSGENNLFYNRLCLNKDDKPVFRPVLYGDILVYTAMNTQTDTPGLAFASISENKIYGIMGMNYGKNSRAAFDPDSGKVFFTTDNTCYIIYIGEDIASTVKREFSIKLSDDDYISKVAVSDKLAVMMTNNGTVHFQLLEGTNIQNFAFCKGTYDNIALTDNYVVLKGQDSSWDGSHTVDVYSYKLMDNVEAYLDTEGTGKLYSGVNLDGIISLKRKTSEHFLDRIYDSDSCELIFSYEDDNEGAIYENYAPSVSENTILNLAPYAYSVYDYKNKSEETIDDSDMIIWYEKINEQSPFKDIPESHAIDQFSDENYIYFRCWTETEAHGEKYSLSDGSLEEIIEFSPIYDSTRVQNYYICGDVRVEMLSNNQLFIYKNNAEAARYKCAAGNYLVFNKDTIAFSSEEDTKTYGVIYSLTELKELCRIDGYNGSEQNYYNIKGTGCEYVLIANRFLVNTETMKQEHDFGGTLFNTPVKGFYFNEYLGLWGFRSEDDLFFYDPESFELMFTVKNCYGATPDGKYVFTKAESENMSSSFMKIKVLTEKEIIQKARERYSE